MNIFIISVSGRLLLFLLLLCMRDRDVLCNDIELIDKGVITPTDPKAISLEFYVTVQNVGHEPQSVRLETNQCCLKMTGRNVGSNNNGDVQDDCESMTLPNLLPKIVKPEERRNLSTYFVNMYLDKRQGYCRLFVKWYPAHLNPRPRRARKFTEQEDVLIKFNIDLSNQKTSSYGFFHKLLGYFGLGKSKVKPVKKPCPNITEDVTEGCQAVNCLLKYDGHRSYFNDETNRCEKVPICGTKIATDDNQRNVVGSSLTNKCKAIRSYPIKVTCINGNHTGNGCKCNPGWVSKSFPSNTFNPEKDTYEMCSSKVETESQSESQSSQLRSQDRDLELKKLLFLICVTAIICVVFCCVFPFCWREIRARRSAGNGNNDGNQNPISSSPSKVISEVVNRREPYVPRHRQQHHQKSEGNSPEIDELKSIGKRNGKYPLSDLENVDLDSHTPSGSELDLHLERVKVHKSDNARPILKRTTRTETNTTKIRLVTSAESVETSSSGDADVKMNAKKVFSENDIKTTKSTGAETMKKSVKALLNEMPGITGVSFSDESLMSSPEDSQMTGVMSSNSESAIVGSGSGIRRNLSGVYSEISSSQSSRSLIDLHSVDSEIRKSGFKTSTGRSGPPKFTIKPVSLSSSYLDFHPPSDKESKLRAIMSELYLVDPPDKMLDLNASSEDLVPKLIQNKT